MFLPIGLVVNQQIHNVIGVPEFCRACYWFGETLGLCRGLAHVVDDSHQQSLAFTENYQAST